MLEKGTFPAKLHEIAVKLRRNQWLKHPRQVTQMKPITWKFHSVLAGALTMVVLSIFPAEAQVSVISVLPQFTEDTSVPSNPTDTFDWSTLGATDTDITTPASVTSDGGLSATVLNGGGTLEQVDEEYEVLWAGNFAPGATLLWNQGNQNNITIDFNSPVQGAGAQIMADYYGSFTAQIDIYGSANNLLATFTENGESNGDNDNSAIYLGAHSTNGAADIYSISFSTPTTYYNGNDFAIGNLLIGVPEPTSTYAAWTSVLACCIAILHRSFRRNEEQSVSRT
jgi:hypothetical protein